MAKAKFQLEGIGAIAKALNALEPKLAKKIIRSEIRKALKPVKAEVMSQAPVDSGELKSHVKIRAMKRKRGRIGVKVEIGKGDFKGDQWYAGAVEYGHSTIPRKRYVARKIQSVKSAFGVEFGNSMVPPNPFMRRSFDAKAPAARDQVEAGILARIDDEVRKLKATTP